MQYMADHPFSLHGRWREAMRLSRCLLRCSVSVSVSDSVPPPFLTHPLSDQFPSRNLNQFKAHAKEPQTWLQIAFEHQAWKPPKKTSHYITVRIQHNEAGRLALYNAGPLACLYALQVPLSLF